MKMGQAVRVVATAGFLLLLLAGMVTGAFFLTALLYRTIGHAPPPFLVQVINALLGVCLSVLLAVGLFAWINARPRAKPRAIGGYDCIDKRFAGSNPE